jgi:hypothetical protein
VSLFVARPLVLTFALALCAGCQPLMNRQPKIPKPDSPNDFFADGRGSRPLEPGTVARGQLRAEAPRYTGRTDAGAFVDEFPVPVTEDFVRHGRERFNIYCSHCHDRTGTGNGKVVQRGYIKPPLLVEAPPKADPPVQFNPDDHLSRGYRIRGERRKLSEVSPGYVFDVISQGYGAMPSHAELIPVDDRWAIVAYVRALQLTGTGEGGTGGQ